MAKRIMTPEEENNLRTFAREFVTSAKARKLSAPSCAGDEVTAVHASRSQYVGWSLMLSSHTHPASGGRGTSVGHYSFSAKLMPAGRSSTDADWYNLGAIVNAVVRASGHPMDRQVMPLLPLETTHPNSAMYWMWHDDGSEVDVSFVEASVQAIQIIQQREIEAGVQQRLSTAAAAGRNDLCPCGSGKKFKRCHGN